MIRLIILGFLDTIEELFAIAAIVCVAILIAWAALSPETLHAFISR